MTTDLVGAFWECVPYLVGCLFLLVVDIIDRWRHPDY